MSNLKEMRQLYMETQVSTEIFHDHLRSQLEILPEHPINDEVSMLERNASAVLSGNFNTSRMVKLLRYDANHLKGKTGIQPVLQPIRYNVIKELENCADFLEQFPPERAEAEDIGEYARLLASNRLKLTLLRVVERLQAITQ